MAFTHANFNVLGFLDSHILHENKTTPRIANSSRKLKTCNVGALRLLENLQLGISRLCQDENSEQMYQNRGKQKQYKRSKSTRDACISNRTCSLGRSEHGVKQSVRGVEPWIFLIKKSVVVCCCRYCVSTQGKLVEWTVNAFANFTIMINYLACI